MLRWLILVLVAVFAVRFFTAPDPILLGAGVRAPDPPSQRPIEDPIGFALNGYQVTPLADFALRAKVLGREDYRIDREAELSPMDLALGWGPMSDEDVLATIDISQSGRWYRWRAEHLPIPRRQIETHSANMHLIPADDGVLDALREIRAGQIVELAGQLVRADHIDGWRWVSSMTRNDTGARACELIFVQRARIISG